jgi:hypothetical protein
LSEVQQDAGYWMLFLDGLQASLSITDIVDWLSGCK